MKFFSVPVAAAACAALASGASAVGQLGFDLGVQNNDGSCKQTSDFNADLATLKPYTNVVRVYAASDCGTLENIAPALLQNDFKAFVGIWPTDDAHYAAEKAAAAQYLPTLSVDNVEAFTVGSEALYRGDLTPSALAAKISDFKSFVADIKDKDGKSYSSIPVGFVDSWNIIVNATNQPAIQAADIILANAFSYWQGQTMANATFSFVDDIMQALQVIQTSKGNNEIEFWIGETGWATAGGNFEAAVPSTANAASFWESAICGIRGWGVNTIVFEAFDETWKPVTSGVDGVEQHWGVFADHAAPKYSLSCDFSGN
ncbi:glucan 1,3-beta-glucosidase [Trichomonascus vanleenenianus]|uniref:glucan 1,3-beta-glucosidase n=1 Tax=Trichomonascus vanleenenianus TaxID=2268995 RepID=UPI003ECA10C7